MEVVGRSSFGLGGLHVKSVCPGELFAFCKN